MPTKRTGPRQARRTTEAIGTVLSRIYLTKIYTAGRKLEELSDQLLNGPAIVSSSQIAGVIKQIARGLDPTRDDRIPNSH